MDKACKNLAHLNHTLYTVAGHTTYKDLKTVSKDGIKYLEVMEY